MRRWWVLVLLIACGDDAEDVEATLDRSLLDASVSLGRIDAGTPNSGDGDYDAATLTPTCAPLDVCDAEGKPGLLYNVCVVGGPVAVAQPSCLVDPNGTLYLAPIASGAQLLMAERWTNGATLSTADQARCDAARIKLLADASAPPKCAGGAAQP